MFTPQRSLLDSIRRTLEQRSVLTARSRNGFVQALHVASKASSTPRRTNHLKDKVIAEIISSEETYIDGLKQLLQFQDVGLDKIIFINLETIIQVNEKLLEDLKSDKENIGKAFISYAPYLKHYSAFASGFSDANKMLQNLTPEVKGRLGRKEFQMGRTIQSLLITPIQRVPRYKLLIEQLIGVSGGRNTKDLIGALKCLSTVASHMNEFVRQHENNEKLISYQTMIGGQTELLVPGRTLLMSGEVFKVSSGKPIHLILTSDNIVVAKLRGEFGRPGSMDVSLILPLKTMTVSMADAYVELHCPPEVFRFSSDSNINWYDEIQDGIWTLKSKRATLKKPFSSVAEPIKRKNLALRANLNLNTRSMPKCNLL